MARRRWSIGLAITGALGVIVACSDAGTEQIVLDGGGGATPDAGSGGSAGIGGTGATGGTGAVSSGGSAGTGATGGSGGAAGAAGAAGSSGGAGGAGGTSAAGGTAGTGGTGGSGGSAGGPPCSSSPTCQANEICSETCGLCGTRSRLCDSTGNWLPWGACVGESGVCQTGQQKTEDCGKCGTRTFYCSTTCDWLPGPCTGEGACLQGAIQTTTASCPTGQVRAQLCDATCNFGPFSNCSTQYTWKTVAASPLDGRREFGFAWAGGELYIVGGYGTGGTSTYKDDAAKYNPATDTWTSIAKLPGQRFRTELVSTGTELIYWGGNSTSTVTYANDGARYDIAQNAWTAIPGTGTNVPEARYGHAVVWDQVGQKLIVWGGYGASGAYFADGASWDAATGTWTPLPASPLDGRRQFAFAWDPVRRWLYVWGGYGTFVASTSYYRNDGAIYDAAANTWTQLPAVPSSIGHRYGMPGVVLGDKFVVWGGYGATPSYKLDGATYDAVSKTWSLMAPSPLDGRYYHLGVASGSKVFFFGGYGTNASTYKNDGAVFDAATGTWAAAPAASVDGRYQLGGAWTPSGIVVWGGYGSGGASLYKNDGALYQP